jgi:hypothetical protein
VDHGLAGGEGVNQAFSPVFQPGKDLPQGLQNLLRGSPSLSREGKGWSLTRKPRSGVTSTALIPVDPMSSPQIFVFMVYPAFQERTRVHLPSSITRRRSARPLRSPQNFT